MTMKRMYLTMRPELAEAVEMAAKKKGMTPTSLVISNLEDLYLMEEEAVNYDEWLKILRAEAQKMPVGVPFLMADLPSYARLIVSTATKAHVSPSTLRARIAKNFNAEVRKGNVPNIVRATRVNKKDGTVKLMNKNGVAMFVKQ